MEEFLAQLHPIWQPHRGQLEFLISPAKIKVLACGRRWGKTDACAVQSLAALFREQPSKHLLIAPTQDQANLLFQRLRDLLEQFVPDEAIKSKLSPYPTLGFRHHRVSARSGHIPRALRGNEATHIVVDEAAYLPESLITEVAMPMLATTEGQMTLISTPHGKNHFWRFFEMGQKGEHGIWSRRAPSAESPYVSPSFLDVQRELISERAFRIEYEAEFEDSAGRVFKTEAVESCLTPELDPIEPPFLIGVDWARYEDYTAVCVLAGDRSRAQLVELVRFHGTTWTEAVGRVAGIASQFPKAGIWCDATGSGDPVLEQLKKALPGHKIDGVVFTEKRKHELIDSLTWLFERSALRMTPHPELLRELEHFEAEPTSRGGMRLAARSGHDDLVIALALAAAQLSQPYHASIQTIGERAFSETTHDEPLQEEDP